MLIINFSLNFLLSTFPIELGSIKSFKTFEIGAKNMTIIKLIVSQNHGQLSV